mmetsp:Transcript_28902/g.41418  ORF Transcript_28902/g.41418 Transcript_28902/m.41418 type:complete len:81 (-) Transcript_28902:630-872(-)
MDDLVEANRLGALRYQKTTKKINLLSLGLKETMEMSYGMREEIGEIKQNAKETLTLLRRGFESFEKQPDFVPGSRVADHE